MDLCIAVVGILFVLNAYECVCVCVCVCVHILKTMHWVLFAHEGKRRGSLCLHTLLS